jgi:hypothetical protein
MTQRTMTDGSPETPDHREIDPETGMQKGYVVLSQEERAKGFVRPLRLTYVHVGNGAQFDGCVLIKAGRGACGNRTSMGRAIAETYSRDPKFYTGTFCATCKKHFPLREFVWEGTQEEVGS